MVRFDYPVRDNISVENGLWQKVACRQVRNMSNRYYLPDGTFHVEASISTDMMSLKGQLYKP